ncbi:MAG: diguanylate cyclase domain-containing protein, partial [Bacillota bacterium]
QFSIITRSGCRVFCEAAFSPVEFEAACAVLVEIVDVTRHRLQSDALTASELRYRETVDSLSEVVFELDMEGNLLFANRRAFDFWGVPPEVFEKGIRPMDFICPEDRERCVRNMERVARGENLGVGEYIAQRYDGRRFPVLIASSPLIRNGKTVGIRGVIMDDSVRKQRDEIQNRYNLLSEYARDIILFIRPDGGIIEANNAAAQIYGWSREELLTMSVDEIFAGHPGVHEGLTAGERCGNAPLEVINRRRDGSVFPAEVTSQNAIIGGEPITIAIVRDISERKAIEREMAYLSLHDPLTGLFNRAYFEQETKRLAAAPRPTGVVVCDADGLKLINDTLGHKKGDALLRSTASAIRESVRKGDVVTRIGGDEFAVLLRDCDRQAVEDVCARIRNAVQAHNETGSDLALSVSIGSAFHEACSDINALFKEADNNMYREKLKRGQSTRSALVQTLMRTLESRDISMRRHASRMRDLAVRLASAVGLPEERMKDLALLARFHDIGKVGVPDRVLFKPGSLTASEWAEMWSHCEIGHRIAKASPDLEPIADWILKHHERWDGNGYPLGLKGRDIPVECRILAIVDAYDAMTTDRSYRRAMSHVEAMKELDRCACTQFDPDLVRIFMGLVTGASGQVCSPILARY